MPIARVSFYALARKRLLNAPVWLWATFVAVSAVFLLIPQIDLAVSRAFYTPDIGFETKGIWYERLVHRSVGVSLVLGNIALIVIWGVRALANRQAINFRGKELVFLLVFLGLGPGLVVNGLLKENWGRARPADIVQFGGTREFTPAFVLSDQGGKSFSSGHAAASFFWILVALLIAPRHKLWIFLAVAYCLVVSWMRIAAGGHFLSDVVTSYFIMAILALAMYGAAYRKRESAS
jgi:lipid A 4'-phosphatase